MLNLYHFGSTWTLESIMYWTMLQVRRRELIKQENILKNSMLNSLDKSIFNKELMLQKEIHSICLLLYLLKDIELINPCILHKTISFKDTLNSLNQELNHTTINSLNSHWIEKNAVKSRKYKVLLNLLILWTHQLMSIQEKKQRCCHLVSPVNKIQI